MTIIKPTTRDIKFGRGKDISNGDGNQTLIAFAKQKMFKYIASCSKKEKALIVKEIISMLMQEGRNFYEKNTATNEWQIASDKRIHTKITQCIRDVTPKKLRKPACSSPKTVISCAKNKVTSEWYIVRKKSIHAKVSQDIRKVTPQHFRSEDRSKECGSPRTVAVKSPDIDEDISSGALEETGFISPILPPLVCRNSSAMKDNFFDKLEDIEMFEEVLELLLLVED
ncbi:hypothetical protein CTEN210_07672 [Chaetoceros tenuissimus]|uniref:DUF6824 domain-containing protein n=1 Tax=Chaetoceros tenuissimus TaxID=426638 RepID=A0AAD3H5N1_9STRA|nr:hypothetical protein CTEN210_07672 [Chaetoceros tenuissimus]